MARSRVEKVPSMMGLRAPAPTWAIETNLERTMERMDPTAAGGYRVNPGIGPREYLREWRPGDGGAGSFSGLLA